MPKLNEYLTVAQAAQVLGVSKDTLRRWDKSGKLMARRHPVTGYRLYLQTELDSFLRRVSQDAKTPPRSSRTDGRRGTPDQGA